MKLILRKSDSATNLLLFIYSFKKRFEEDDTYDLKLSTILEIMRLFGKSESSVRMSLSRAVKSHLLENVKYGNEVHYLMTPSGKQFIDTSVNESDTSLKRYYLRNTEWDKKWFCIILSNSNDIQKEEKMKLVERISRLGFSNLTGDMWVSPYLLSNEIYSLVDELGCRDSIVTLRSEMMTDYDLKKFWSKIYRLNRFEAPYKAFIKKYEIKLNELRALSNGEMIENNDFIIPLLYELGLVYFSISSYDPFLPKDIKTTWIGDKAASLMLELMDIIMPNARRSFNSFS